MNPLFEACKNRISQVHSIALFIHQNPDFDSVGSGMALCLLLESLGKKVQLFIPETLSDDYSILPNTQKFVTAEAAALSGVDLAICLDTSSLKRISGIEMVSSLLRSVSIINIDHHKDNEKFGDINIVESTCSSVGELLMHMFMASDWIVTADMGTCLYASIAYDTGRFQYANTSASTLLIASKLVDLGANHVAVNIALFENQSLKSFSDLRIGLENLIVNDDLKFAYTSLPYESRENANSLVSFIRTLKAYEVFMVFRDEGEGRVKVSLRSRNTFDVQKFAAHFGGGGHQKASGITINGTIEDVKKSVLQELEKRMMVYHEGLSSSR